MGRITCSPGARRQGWRSSGRPDGDDSVHGDGGRRRKRATRFGRLLSARHARLRAKEEEGEVELGVSSDGAGVAEYSGARRRRERQYGG